MSLRLYRVKDWGSLYENNRTRELKAMAWVPVPNRHDGDGYTTLISRQDGAAMFGAWIAILQVASRCDPRGTLLRDGAIPHNPESLSRMTRIPKKILELALEICCNECKWLEIIVPHEGAGIPQDDAGECLGMEGKERTEGNGMEGNILPETHARVLIHFLNEKTGRAFRETDANLTVITARLKEDGVDIAGCKMMIERQVRRWKGTESEEYLRPETLFGKTKFDSYYAAKYQPVPERANGNKINGFNNTKTYVKPDHTQGF